MFRNVLIANRGEVALRVIRACRRLGVGAIAVYSDADAEAPYVRAADRAIHIGPAEARKSYLNAPRIVGAARASGADAIHPGYGFFAENADFARRCAEAGLVFVGPSPDVIAKMGAKIEAKRLAEAAGVACVPGYHGEDQSDAALYCEAARIGTPLLIKASAGGGGRGMRRIDDLNSLGGALAAARSEAEAAFGVPALLLEKYIEAPRHIEVQILADRHGRVVHLFERDCSIQRNYQKLIEEAPAPNLDPVLREQILDDAVRLAREIGYDNAGTVEFVVDTATGEAFFLEMNTRLQVEHPVTECVTGIDLVEWQLRIAAGEPLSFSQDRICCNGWAVEARVAAENPSAGYRPETGRISRYAEPTLKGVRVDSGVECGSQVSPYYDSMLAKVIAHGADRPAAVLSLCKALTQFRIGGVTVNTGFLHDVLALDVFRTGEHHTESLKQAFPRGWTSPALTDTDLARAVLARHIGIEANSARSPWWTLGAWRIGEALGWNGAAYYHASVAGGAAIEISVRGRGGSYTVQRGEDTLLEVSSAGLEDDELSYTENSIRHLVLAIVASDGVTLVRRSGDAIVAVSTAEIALLGASPEAKTSVNHVAAPTPGLIIEVLVEAGQRVTEGETAIVLEAMKLLQQLRAPVSGVVETVYYVRGDTVEGGTVLVEILPDECDNQE